MTTPKHEHFALEPGTKLIVRVLQDLVRTEHFEDYADLSEALKRRCAKLKIRYDSGLISDAIDRLERGGKTPLIARPRRPRLVERTPDYVPLSRDDATRLKQELLARFRGRA